MRACWSTGETLPARPPRTTLSKSGCVCFKRLLTAHELVLKRGLLRLLASAAESADPWHTSAAACTNSSWRSNCSACGGPGAAAVTLARQAQQPESTRVSVSSRASSCAWRSAFCWRSSANCFSVSRRLAFSCLMRRLTNGTVAASSATSASSPSDGDAARLASSGGGASCGGADSPCTPGVLPGQFQPSLPFPPAVPQAGWPERRQGPLSS